MSREPFYDRSWCLPLAGLLAMTLGACATALPAPQPFLESLGIPSIRIAPTSLGGVAAGEREWFLELLSDHATATARRVSVELRLAERVERSRESHRAHHLSGSVAIPIALPPEYRGSHAAFQKGSLAVARLELRESTGKLISTVEATVLWKDVRWTTGAHKARRARRPDAALIDAVELAVERALKRLLPELRAQPTARSGLGTSEKESGGRPI